MRSCASMRLRTWSVASTKAARRYLASIKVKRPWKEAPSAASTWSSCLWSGAMVAFNGFLGAVFFGNPGPGLGLALAGVAFALIRSGSGASKGVGDPQETECPAGDNSAAGHADVRHTRSPRCVRWESLRPLLLTPLVVPIAWIAARALDRSIVPERDTFSGLVEAIANLAVAFSTVAGISVVTVVALRSVPTRPRHVWDRSPDWFGRAVRVMSMAAIATAVVLIGLAMIPLRRPRVDAYLSSLPVVATMPSPVTYEEARHYCASYSSPATKIVRGDPQGEERPRRHGEIVEVTRAGKLRVVRRTRNCLTGAVGFMSNYHCEVSLVRADGISGLQHPPWVPSGDATWDHCGPITVRADEARGLWFVEPGRVAFAMSTEPQVVAATPHRLKGLRPPQAFPAVAAIGVLAALSLLVRQRISERQSLVAARKGVTAARDPYRHSSFSEAVGEDLELSIQVYAQALAIVLQSLAPLAGALGVLAG